MSNIEQEKQFEFIKGIDKFIYSYRKILQFKPLPKWNAFTKMFLIINLRPAVQIYIDLIEEQKRNDESTNEICENLYKKARKTLSNN